jgi:flagellar protein FlbD
LEYYLIHLTRLNHVPLILNADLIEHVEVTPDTVVALTTGQKFLVLESADEVVEKVIEFRRTILRESHCPLKSAPVLHSPDSAVVLDR